MVKEDQNGSRRQGNSISIYKGWRTGGVGEAGGDSGVNGAKTVGEVDTRVGEGPGTTNAIVSVRRDP